MEYILQDTDIFDEEITEKFNEFIINNKENFISENVYKFTVSFHVNLLKDNRFEKFNLPVPSKTSKKTKKDKIYDVMSFQLENMANILNENGIEVYSTTIQGDYLESDNIIKIEISEDNFEYEFSGRRKIKKRMKVSSIIPSLPFTQKIATKFASERINKIYWDLMNIIKSKKIMAEILEIDATEDDKKLFKEFANQYGELWLTTSKKEKDLIQQLQKKIISVANKYIEQEEKTAENNIETMEDKY